ncbi:MAG: dTDP-4-dehydrorhamnose 3,5-epimerase [Clostridia bacterium]|nr:dTDP-4-dehydrorhamnose 3,5-epimerase [Clostridia bacterium]MBQ2940381.1 dTDP-4-dehydrorhamnose 3,5-epimerase [Clostridia bacterium]
MGKLTVEKTPIDGVVIVTPAVYGDERGYFTETYNERDYAEAGIDVRFVQDNQSRSRRGVLRGLHFQKNYPQSKLVRVLEGEVFDVAVDLRPESPTYGQWVGVLLTAENHKQFFVPRGFAHGFLVLSETATFAYKCDEFYHPEDEGGLAWNDPTVGVAWPITPDMELLLSEKDRRQPTLR